MRERSRKLLDPLSLRLFAAVARYGSIAEAGRQEDMAASAVSKRLSDLEAAVGAALLERGTRGVALTAAGEAVLHHAEDLQSLTDRLQADLDDIQGGRRGELRLAAATSALLGRLADDLARFAARYPDVHISLHEAPSLEAFDLIAGGAVDLAAVTDYEIPAKLERRRYEADPVWVVTPLDHPLVEGVPAGKPVRFQDALAYEVISAPTQGAPAAGA